MKGKLNLVFIALLVFQLVAGGIATPMQSSAEGSSNDNNENSIELTAENDANEEETESNDNHNDSDSNLNEADEGADADENEGIENNESSENENEANENESENEGENTPENEDPLEGEEEKSVDEEILEESEEEEQSIRPAAEQSNEHFNLNISKIKDLDGNVYDENNPLKPSDEFIVRSDWSLEDGHTYQNGDTTTFQLPKELQLNREFSGDLQDELGNVVATYHVNQSGQVTLTFTEFVEDNSNISGWLEISAFLNQDEVLEEEGNAIVGPIEDEGNFEIPIDRTPINKTVEKQGDPNKGYNADEIEWTVTINKNANTLKDVTLEDLLPEGTEYVDGSLKVEKQNATIGGKPVGEKTEVSVTPSINDGKLSVPLGDIEEVYTLTYTTKVTEEGMDLTTFKNKVVFNDGELEPTEAEATVNVNRGEPLKKGAIGGKDAYDPKTGVIQWYLDFNHNQKSLNDVTLSDSWADSDAAGKMEVIADSVKFQELEIDESGNVTNVGEPKSPSEIGATFTDNGDGFEISGITTDKPYRVLYETKVKERELDGFRIENTAGFADVTTGEGYNVDQYVGAKSAGDINYKDKTINWTIRVNMDERQMNDIEITDTLGDGLTLIDNSVKVTVGGEEKTDITITSGNPFTITNIGSTDKEVVVTYTTSYDPNKLPEDYKAKNKADISWIPEGETERIERGVNAERPVNNETVNPSWKSASYNPDSKEISWMITANYRENAYEDFKIIDQPQGNQKLLADTIEVYELEIQENGDIVEKEKVDVKPEIDGNNFTLNIGETDKAYRVVYKTSLDGLEDLAKEYANKAEVLDGEEGLAELDAKVSVYGDRKYGDKRGTQDGRKMNWSIDVNLAQEVISNLQLEDEISDNQEYIEDSITVYNAKLNKEDGTVSKVDEVDPSDYELVADGTSFSIKWNDTVERPYIVEYSTMFFDKPGAEVSNSYKITGDGIDEEDLDASDSTSFTLEFFGDGGAQGDAGYLMIQKLDTTFSDNNEPDENATPIEGIEFDLIDTRTGSVLKTITTDEDGYADFGRLLFGEYQLVEKNVPEGYEAPQQDTTITIDQAFNPGEDDPLNYVQTIANYKEIEIVDIPVEKVWKGKATDDIEVHLLNGEEKVDEVTLSDDNNWKHTFKAPKVDQEGNDITYTVNEVSVDGYKTNIAGDMNEGFTITNTQTGETEVSVEKVWELYEKEKETVTVNLLADGEQVDSEDLSDENDWEHTFTGLDKFDSKGEPIDYTVDEVEIDGFEIEISGDVTDGFTITNTEIVDITPIEPITKVDVEKVWEDKDNKHEVRPETITVNLLADGEEVDSIELSDENNWKHSFNSLPKFSDDAFEEAIDYTVEEVEVDNYAPEITGDQEEGFTITNTVKDYAIGDYVWVDHNKDGIQDDNEEPLEGVKVELYYENGDKIAETETDENGRYIFDELLAGDYKVKFELTDEQKEKYRFTKEQAGDDTTVDSDADEETGWTRDIVLNDDNEHLTHDYDHQDFKATEGIDPTWDAGVIELVQIPVEKVWKDNDNAEESRPDAITVNVIGNDEVETTADLTAEDGWSHIFKGLDKYDENGEEINYSVEEEAVEGYEGEVEETEEGFVITNTLQKPISPIFPITKVDVEKVWEGKALDEVEIVLYANGEEMTRITLSDDNNWKHTFNSLPKYLDSGQEELIEYTIDEVDVDGYEKSITGDQEEGFIVTNTEIPETPENPEDPEKPTDDPKDPEKPSDDPKEEGDGEELPKTATHLFNFLAIGLGVIALGLVLLFLARRKQA